MKWHQLLAHSQCLLNIQSHGHTIYMQTLLFHKVKNLKQTFQKWIRGLRNTYCNTGAFKKTNLEKSTPKRYGSLWSTSRLPLSASFWSVLPSQSTTHFKPNESRDIPRLSSNAFSSWQGWILLGLIRVSWPDPAVDIPTVSESSHQKRRMSKINSQREHDLWPLTSHLCVSVT